MKVTSSSNKEKGKGWRPMLMVGTEKGKDRPGLPLCLPSSFAPAISKCSIKILGKSAVDREAVAYRTYGVLSSCRVGQPIRRLAGIALSPVRSTENGS